MASNDVQGGAKSKMSLKGCVRVLLVDKQREDRKSIRGECGELGGLGDTQSWVERDVDM